MIDNFFNNALRTADLRIAASKNTNKYQLDKNEQSNDIDFSLKEKVLERLLDANWNRYPDADYKDIEIKIAEYCNLKPENIVLSAGSASIITTLLDYFAINNKQIIIAQPAYSLFDYHCKTYNIKYLPWHLNDELEYDIDNLPELGSDSVLIITSPNNPTGNTIELDYLEFLLERNPEALIIVDAVYAEFCDSDYTQLISKFNNLMVLRSFSKSFPIAGLRLGYLCAAPVLASVIKKLILQFSITHFSLIFARELLFDQKFVEDSRNRVRDIIKEREELYLHLNCNFYKKDLKVFRSEGNFLLIRIYDDSVFKDVLEALEKKGIKVLNTSKFPMLQNTFRVSIGNTQENAAFIRCIDSCLHNIPSKV